MKGHPRILIACVGNIFLGDDAFGVEVARRLQSRQLPREVRVIDFGIRGFDLTMAMLEPYETVILVDAAQRGHPPGTVSLIEPDIPAADAPADGYMVQMHNLDPAKVLQLARGMGAGNARILLVACEPQTFGTDLDPADGLSAPVAAAVDEAIATIESLVHDMLIPAARVGPVTRSSGSA